MESIGSKPGPDGVRKSGEASSDVGSAAQHGTEPAGAGHLFGYLAVYTVLRVGLVVVLTAVLAFFMPLIVALMFAIIVQLPLAWLLFSGPRARVNDAIAVQTARRREERARLQSALSGEPTVLDGSAGTGQSPTAGAAPGGDTAP